ncbi:Protein phosphatase 2C family protein [Rhynchospora pubera]|uniref:protein-serine/threonine phosphatase n=1 Tax=Rhynchospora pubera TaxID=906938 RepID=A0AAV8D868_9POAL|nr:Protein phosphatase 2C family protein [Rhynchospora pubera]
MSCSVAIANSPVFSPSTSRVSLSCKASSETLTLALAEVSPSPAPSSPSFRPVLSSSGFGSMRGGSLLKRKRPDRIDIPLPDMAFVDLLGSDGSKELEEEREGFAVYCKRGKKRSEMEDRYVAKSDLCGDSKTAFFGVFDGHSGKQAAEFASEKMGELISEQIRKQDEETSTAEIEEAIKIGYMRTDEQFLSENISGGTCCVTALIQNGELFISNAGDCRAVLSREGNAEAVTSDHRPSREDERDRIESLGGFVHYCHGTWRLQGSLAVSRGIGDSHFKQWVIPEPETQKLQIGSKSEFVILASDGLWDKVTNQEAVDIVRPFFTDNSKARTALSACKKLVELSISRGSADDISVMVIQLQHFIV